jgi:hypothetical protein
MDMITGYEFRSIHDPDLFCLFVWPTISLRLFNNPLNCDCVDYQVYTL